MSKSLKKTARPWRVVAEEMSHATRGNEILELAEELDQALHEQTATPPPQKMAAAASNNDSSRTEKKNLRSG